MGEVVELTSAIRARRVDDLCEAIAVNDDQLNDGETRAIQGSVQHRIGELNFHWTADEAEKRGRELLRAAEEARTYEQRS